MRSRSIRRLVQCLALTVVLGQSACFVADELDQGEAILDHNSARGAVEKQQAAPARGGAKETPAEQQIANWWHSVHSLSPVERSADVVRCRIGGAPTYVSRSDCLARGGDVAE